MTDVNPAENNFPVAVVDQPANLLLNVLWRTALQARTHLRNDAVGAVQNAPVLDFDVRAAAAIKMADAPGDVDDAQTIENVGQFALVANDLKDAGQVFQDLRLARGIAPHDDCAGTRVAASQLANQLPSLGIGFARYGAGIHDAQVGGFVFRCLAEAVVQKRLFHQLRFVLIDFAAERDEPACAFGHCRFRICSRRVKVGISRSRRLYSCSI